MTIDKIITIFISFIQFNGKTLTDKQFPFFSPEHNQKFTAENISLKIEKEPDNPNMLQLNIDGMNILEWSRKKYRECQSVGIRARHEQKKTGE